ncbi:hypothetical protein GPX89_15165 [Nocardia sp. ET3-3]|uniref:Uncharacterized protein n=1 Tax=Nocardia terrae TaxID=2675851 RepID=A0A7K1UW20_9NOCA|nr:hypothetical protein [Nocardia terrae]MVU78583.1 hypothetical protein [Nocardia terrae]
MRPTVHTGPPSGNRIWLGLLARIGSQSTDSSLWAGIQPVPDAEPVTTVLAWRPGSESQALQGFLHRAELAARLEVADR